MEDGIVEQGSVVESLVAVGVVKGMLVGALGEGGFVMEEG